MQAYFIRYKRPDSKFEWTTSIDAKNLDSAQRKIERKIKHPIEIIESKIIGYY